MIPLAGCVLAGGRSTRMGRDKARLRLGGRSFHALAVDTLLACTGAVFTCGEHGDPDEVRSRTLRDPYQCGPLGGMVAALESIDAAWVIFLPVDMPLLPVSWLQHLATLTEGCEESAIVTRSPDGPQPLVCACSRRMLPQFRTSMQTGERSVQGALGDSVRWAGTGTLSPALFRNLNRFEEVSLLRELGFDIS